MIDASRVATGPAPTTEEEAYIYNKAREYLPRAGFEVASAATPTVPKVVGGLPIRPAGGSALGTERTLQPTNGVLSVGPRPARSETYIQPPAVLRPAGTESAGNGIRGGLTSSPAELPWWMRALLPPDALPAGLGGPLPVGVGRQALPPIGPGANKSLGISNAFSDKPIPRMSPIKPPSAPEASGGGRLPPSIIGLTGLPSDHRELTRIDANPRRVVLSRPGDEDEPRHEIESPPLAPEQAPPERKRSEITASGAGGNKIGGRKKGNGGKRYCSRQKEAEEKACRQTWNERKAIGLDTFPWTHFLIGCLDRAGDRYRLCLRNLNKDNKLAEWGIPDEEEWYNSQR